MITDIIYDGLFQEYDLSDKITNNFPAVTFSFLVCENYLEICLTTHILGTDQHNNYFSGQLPSRSCNSLLNWPENVFFDEWFHHEVYALFPLQIASYGQFHTIISFGQFESKNSLEVFRNNKLTSGRW